MQIIYTDNLILRPLKTHDKKIFCQLYTNPTTMAYIAPVYSDKKASNSFNSACNFNENNERTVNTWAIELSNTKSSLKIDSDNAYSTTHVNTIGMVMLYDEWQKKALSTIEIGILLLPDKTGQSFGKEALSGLLTHCFNNLSFHQINIRFHPNNLAMRSVSKKLGFLPITNTKPNNNSHSNNSHSNDNYENIISSNKKTSSMEGQMWVHSLFSK
jgi:RimJ/RimL family protein N-acetyltransferase